MAKRTSAFTVTASDVEVGYDDLGPALSRSITEASKAKREITVYVRDAAGDVVGYSESDERRNVTTVRHEKVRPK
jgi:hypothetical protein